MRTIFALLLLIPLINFAQTDSGVRQPFSKKIRVKSITDSPNFVDDTLRILMINYFKDRNIDIKRCLIDKLVRQNQNGVTVIIRDSLDLENEKKTKKPNDASQNYQSIGGTFEYDRMTKKLVFYPDE
jgi:nicotinamide mononucleotide adenylyltransferase